MCAGECAQYLSTFLDGESILLEVYKLLMGGGDGRCVDDQRVLGILACRRNQFHILLIVDDHTFLFQFVCQLGWSLVVTGYGEPFL